MLKICFLKSQNTIRIHIEGENRSPRIVMPVIFGDYKKMGKPSPTIAIEN